MSDTPGIHHVTAIAGDPQPNVDFYTGVLGLRFLKRTVNHEDRFAYHLYYGDGAGSTGSVITFFPYPGDDGRVGKPQPSAVAFAVPEGSLDYWLDRLENHGVERTTRFDERVVRFRDPDGTPLELVTGGPTAVSSSAVPWTAAVPEEAAIRGIQGVTLLSANPYATAATLETLGFNLVAQEDDRVRYRAPGDRAGVVDLLDTESAFGREGPGTIHHVALRVGSEAELFEWHDLFRERGYDVSRVKDRHYYRSVYVREPGGILFELATEPTGLVSGPKAGRTLELPPWFEEDRGTIESQLPPLSLPGSTTS